ncbi:MAG: hypothetical protein CVU84_06710 [Firmicutes bacterium HGW-Firmicutes-1]|jgi:CBS-domain-containing membrane protein|nr:MAG: hypothetical protein CVU84_06710 [Firmicutes bacterium HGW-Firmicutes-1]
MKIFDEKFKHNKGKYISQCIISTTFLMVILLYVDIVLKATIIFSIGATSFIVFTCPKKRSSSTRCILGGYIIGALTGYFCNLIQYFIPTFPFAVTGSIAIGLSIFLMVILNAEHPPAAAFAIGMVIEKYSLVSVLLVIGIASILLLIKKYMGNWFINL